MSKGEYAITLDTDNGIVHVIAHGKLVKALGEEIISIARTKAAKLNYTILYDVRHTEVNISIADWFLLPRTLAIFRDKKIRTIKAAVLISPGKHERIYNFYATVAQNFGMNLRIFLNEAEAVKWLVEK